MSVVDLALTVENATKEATWMVVVIYVRDL